MSAAATNRTTTTNASLSSSMNGLDSSRHSSKHQIMPIRKSILHPMPIVSEEYSEAGSPIMLHTPQLNSTTTDSSSCSNECSTTTGQDEMEKSDANDDANGHSAQHLCGESSDFQYKQKNKLLHDSSSSSIPRQKYHSSSSAHTHRPSILLGAGISFSSEEEESTTRSPLGTLNRVNNSQSIIPNSCK